jgi:hypothetical protein
MWDDKKNHPTFNYLDLFHVNNFKLKRIYVFVVYLIPIIKV